jgi:dCMP deaminase
MGTIDFGIDLEVKQKFIDYFSSVANITSKLSSAKRLQVGAIIVKDNRIISVGYNGMPSGWDNCCEDHLESYDVRDANNPLDPRPWTYDPDTKKYHALKSKPEVLHAEANAITKVAKSTESSEGATLFCTHTPCIECAKLIYQSGISELYINNHYEASKGYGGDFLKKCNITVTYLN